MKTYSELEDYIKGKTVAIVGNANSIFDKEDGALIDGHRVVIRMNFGFVWNNKWIAPKHIGTKTDIVGAGNGLNIYSYMDKYPNYKCLVHLSGATGRTKQEKERLEGKGIPFVYYPIEYWEEMKNLLTKRPSAGMMVFNIVERAKPEHVSTFGFDWKVSKTYYNIDEEVGNPIGPHHWKNERLYIMRKCKMNNWDIL